MVRPLLLIMVLILTGLFAALNWTAFITPTSLNLGFMVVLAPIGMVMLGLLGAVLLAFLVWAISMQGRTLMESRRMTKELQAQRDLADKAEASRFTELRNHLNNRIDQLQHSIEQQGNGLAAHFGQLEDRMHSAERSKPAAVNSGQELLG